MEIKNFLGIRNTAAPERLKAGELVSATDVDISNTGQIMSRRGFTNKNPTANMHSLYATHNVAVCGVGANLKAIESNFSLTQIKALTVSDPISFESTGDIVYYNNGVDRGRLVGSTWSCWGVDNPVGQPVTAQTIGSLPAGKYMYAVTYVRSDGFESGTGLAAVIDITANHGISFTSIPVSPNAEVAAKNLYISTPNGEVMYFAASIPNSMQNYTYTSDALDLTIPLTTQFCYPPPTGSHTRIYNGIAYVLAHGTVYFSLPYNYELFRIDKDFLQFPGEVVMLESVNDGIYVATKDAGGSDVESAGGCWFLAGDRPETFKSTPLFDYGAILGTSVVTDAAYFETQQAGEVEGEESRPVVVWTTRHGICLGKDSGATQNLTELKYSMPTAHSGAAFVRLDRGFASYIVTLRDAGGNTNAYVENIN